MEITGHGKDDDQSSKKEIRILKQRQNQIQSLAKDIKAVHSRIVEDGKRYIRALQQVAGECTVRPIYSDSNLAVLYNHVFPDVVVGFDITDAAGRHVSPTALPRSTVEQIDRIICMYSPAVNEYRDEITVLTRMASSVAADIDALLAALHLQDDDDELPDIEFIPDDETVLSEDELSRYAGPIPPIAGKAKRGMQKLPDPAELTPEQMDEHRMMIAMLENEILNSETQLNDTFLQLDLETTRLRTDLSDIVAPAYDIVSRETEFPSGIKGVEDAHVMVSYSLMTSGGARASWDDLAPELRSSLETRWQEYKRENERFQEEVKDLLNTRNISYNDLNSRCYKETLHRHDSSVAVVYHYSEAAKSMMRVEIDLVTGKKLSMSATQFPENPTAEQKERMRKKHWDMEQAGTGSKDPDLDASVYIAWHESPLVAPATAFHEVRQCLILEHYDTHPDDEADRRFAKQLPPELAELYLNKGRMPETHDNQKTAAASESPKQNKELFAPGEMKAFPCELDTLGILAYRNMLKRTGGVDRSGTKN